MRIPDAAQELPGLPELPTPAETLHTVKEALAREPDCLRNKRTTIIRICNGYEGQPENPGNGWRAELWVTPVEPLREMLNGLADWWEQSIRRAVRECPPPSGGTPQSFSRRTHRPRFKRTLWRKYEGGGEVVVPERVPGTIRLQAIISWQGQADPRETAWPFDLAEITGRITAALAEALGESWVQCGERNTTSRVPGRKST